MCQFIVEMFKVKQKLIKKYNWNYGIYIMQPKYSWRFET